MARSRYRSVAYDLEASIAVARMVAQSGGKTDTVTLASSLSYSGTRNGAWPSHSFTACCGSTRAGRCPPSPI
jgi:hypothetical protein